MGELPYWPDIVENGVSYIFRYFALFGFGLLVGIGLLMLVDLVGWPKWLALKKD